MPINDCTQMLTYDVRSSFNDRRCQVLRLLKLRSIIRSSFILLNYYVENCLKMATTARPKQLSTFIG
jgi:hypothetical protein